MHVCEISAFKHYISAYKTSMSTKKVFIGRFLFYVTCFQCSFHSSTLNHTVESETVWKCNYNHILKGRENYTMYSWFKVTSTYSFENNTLHTSYDMYFHSGRFYLYISCLRQNYGIWLESSEHPLLPSQALNFLHSALKHSVLRIIVKANHFDSSTAYHIK